MIYLLTAIVFLSMFTVLVAVHELGHYLFARRFNMGVHEFAIGFGPLVKTVGKKKFKINDEVEGETVFNFRAIPLGGFVKIWGHEPTEDGSEVNIVGGLYSKPPLQRIGVLFAGPLFSILFGVALLTVVFSTVGEKQLSNKVGMVLEGKPALTAGIKPNDRIVAVNGVKVTDGLSTILEIRKNFEKIELTTERDGTQKITQIPIVLSKEEVPLIDRSGQLTGESKKVPMVGISFADERITIGLGQAFAKSVMLPVQVVQSLVSRMTRPRQLIEESTGVVGMVAVTKSVVENQIVDTFQLCGLISISLGILNLLPIGMLDGGQILIAVVELFRKGKRLSFQTQTAFLTVGMIFILAIFLIVTQKDIRQFVLPQPKTENSAPK